MAGRSSGFSDGFVKITFEKLLGLLGQREGIQITDIIYGDKERHYNYFLVKMKHPNFYTHVEGEEIAIYPLKDVTEKEQL